MRPAVLAAAVLVGATAYLVATNSQASQEPDRTPTDNDPPPDNSTILDNVMSTINNATTDIDSALQNENVQAFLVLIRTGEGTLGPNGYRTMFGGGLFTDFSDHPRQAITRSGITSTAAGAYQFLSRTWDEMASKYDLPDFSPASQDIAAVGLIKRRGALADVIAGRFTAAINKCNREWASLPGSPYGQPTLTYSRALQVLAANGGEAAA